MKVNHHKMTWKGLQKGVSIGNRCSKWFVKNLSPKSLVSLGKNISEIKPQWTGGPGWWTLWWHPCPWSGLQLCVMLECRLILLLKFVINYYIIDIIVVIVISSSSSSSSTKVIAALVAPVVTIWQICFRILHDLTPMKIRSYKTQSDLNQPQNHRSGQRPLSSPLQLWLCQNPRDQKEGRAPLRWDTTFTHEVRPSAKLCWDFCLCVSFLRFSNVFYFSRLFFFLLGFIPWLCFLIDFSNAFGLSISHFSSDSKKNTETSEAGGFGSLKTWNFCCLKGLPISRFSTSVFISAEVHISQKENHENMQWITPWSWRQGTLNHTETSENMIAITLSHYSIFLSPSLFPWPHQYTY